MQSNSGGSTEEIGDRFQRETKHSPESIKTHVIDWMSIPPSFKEYKNPILRVQLPEPKTTSSKINFWRLLLHRRTCRDYNSSASMSLNHLAALLWATQGLTTQQGDTFLRTAPSAGGLYPIETYLAVRSVEGLSQGIYHFRPGDFDLELLKQGDFSSALAQAALEQNMFQVAQTTFIWSAIISRSKWKYNQRAYRYIYLDAGHIAQNLYLAAETIGLGVCAVGSFYDDACNQILGLDGKEETVVYMGTVGVKKR